MDPQRNRPVHSFREFVPIDRCDRQDFEGDDLVSSILCPKCDAIRIWVRRNQHTFPREYRGSKPRTSHIFEHHESGLALEQSYKDGCHLCTLVWVLLTEEAELNSESAGEPINLKRDQRSLHARKRQRLERSILEARELGCIRLELKSIWASPNRIGDAALLPGSGGWPISTDSSSSLRLIRWWMDTCAALHVACNQASPISALSVPSRLLSAPRGTDSVVKVVETASLSTMDDRKYAALSYCWGGSANVRLTRASYDGLTSMGITKSQLPATIQDALDLTATLGFKWLWVDSLCIIQDSAEDWAKEAAKMTDVYQNCEIAFAARGSLDSSQGMFSRRDPLRYVACRLYVDHQDETRSISALPPYVTSGIARSMSWPLETRGWVVQERILPRKMIKFGNYLSWECRESCRDELSADRAMSGYGELPLSQRLFRAIKPAATTTDISTFSPPSYSTISMPDNLRNIWLTILWDYSRLALTSRKDRLVAISGIISTISKATGLQNKAGLWKSNFAEELMWRRAVGEDSNLQSGLKPTWSWISWTCEVRGFPARGGSRQSVSQIRGCTGDEYTRLGIGPDCELALHFKYPYLRAQLSFGGPGSTARDESPWTRRVPGFRSAGDIEYIPDSHVPPDGWDGYTFIPLILEQPPDVYSEKFNMYGLVVRPSTHHPGVFERAGIFEWSSHVSDLSAAKIRLSTAEQRSLILI
ncbi:heterokaryon incompatibility protein-domain-containing protein [Podospora aff. communis PSN243]|uniref:Heterokaryon incompatibility protein-domain-containing protein n=1 Tax=Podospora aff. communis PSN243 TaxID=3040156 RepID=A0AAV9G7Y5_9PEZI|nr:heterokaryon incompatibility protein-domain-containing protein [Podospora aff. communis PSN243]